MRSTKQICLSVSKKNEDTADLIEEYSSHLNLNKAETIFFIINEYHRRRINELYTTA
jgi:hypothetical protein